MILPWSNRKVRTGEDDDAFGFLSEASTWVPDWLPVSAWIEHAPFAFWLIDTLKPGVLVELGTHMGCSFFSFCQAIAQLKLPTRAYAVDTWKGDEHSGFYGKEVFQAVHEHNARRYSGFSQLLRSSFDEALPYFEDGSVDLLHIDGRHFYEDVKHDFDSWYPKSSERGVIVFHDTNVRERSFGVFRFWDELSQHHPHFQFFHGCGLGIIGVGKKVPAGLVELFEAENRPKKANLIRHVYSRLGNNLNDRLQKQKSDRIPQRVVEPMLSEDASRSNLIERFDEDAYLEANKDVAEAVKAGRESSGRNHYETWGRHEGRPLRSRAGEILKYVSKEMRGIEIGPYFNPLASRNRGYNCLSMDVFTADQLRGIAESDVNISRDEITNIGDVDIIGSASEIGEIVCAKYGQGTFDYVVSSHNFEHLPDPIRFLQGCARVLKVNGYLSMAVPDLRCCFDYFRWPTILTEWMEAFFEHRAKPTLSQVFTQNAFHCRAHIGSDNKHSFNLDTDRAVIEPQRTLLEAYRQWKSHQQTSNEAYQDAHCSTFTPASFQLLILELQFLGLIEFTCEEVRGPVGNEFYVHLRRSQSISARNDPGNNSERDLSANDIEGFYEQRTLLLRRVIEEVALKSSHRNQ